MPYCRFSQTDFVNSTLPRPLISYLSELLSFIYFGLFSIWFCSSDVLTEVMHFCKTFLNSAQPCRWKKYYKSWKIPYSLEDAQTMERSENNPFEAWNIEWKTSTLPKFLQAFDIDRLPANLKSRSRQPTKEFLNPQSCQEQSLAFRRRLFGRYGYASGVNPGSLFIDDKSFAWSKKDAKLSEPNVLETLRIESEKQLADAKRIDDL